MATVTHPAGLAGRPDEVVTSAASDAAVYTAAVYLAQGLLFVGGLVQKAILGPAATGYWALIQSIWGFFSVASLGAFDGTTRQIPLHRGRGDMHAAAAVSNTGYSFALAAMAALGCIVAAVALAFGGGWPSELRYGVAVLGLTAPLQFLSDSHETILQATKRLRVVSRAAVLKAVIALVLQTLFAYLFGFYGMFMGLVAVSLGTLIFFTRLGLTGLRRPAFHWDIDRSRLRELIAYGFPIMLVSQMWNLFLATGTLVVAALASPRELGYFALGASVSSYLMYLPKSIGGTLLPRMSERYGREEDVTGLRRYLIDVQHMLGLMLVPALIAAVFLLFPVVIRLALPAFEPGIPVLQIMAVTSFFIALCQMPVKILVTIGRRMALLVMVAMGLAANGLLTYVAIGPLDWGISGAAYGVGVSYLLIFLMTTGYTLAHMVGARQTISHLLELGVSFVYLTAVLLGIKHLLGTGGDAVAVQAVVGTGELALALAALTPWFLVIERRHQGVSQVWRLAAAGVRSLSRPRGRGRSADAGH